MARVVSKRSSRLKIETGRFCDKLLNSKSPSQTTYPAVCQGDGSQSPEALRVVAKRFSELLNCLVKLRWVRRGHGLGTKRTDSIFKPTRLQRSRVQATRNVLQSHIGAVRSIQYIR